jgi:hypothetical protein
MKSLRIDERDYIFETLEELVEMLNANEYIVDLKIKKVGERKTTTVLL